MDGLGSDVSMFDFNGFEGTLDWTDIVLEQYFGSLLLIAQW